MVEKALNLREPVFDSVWGAGRSGMPSIPHAHTQQRKAPYQIQVKQSVRVSNATTVPRPMSLPPQMKGAYHHLRRIDQFVMHTGSLTRLESACPMRFFQLTSKTRLVASDAS